MRTRLSVTFAPHQQDGASIASLTYTTLAALGPAVLAGFYFFGLRAVVIVALSVVSAVVSEAGLEKLMGRPVTVKTGTSILTGLLLALLLPVGTPWWVVIVGAFTAVFLGRQVFGGLGSNPFNAVLVGWVVLRLSWPEAVTTYYEPLPLFEGWGELYRIDPFELPLSMLRLGDGSGIMDIYALWPTLLGRIPGGIGSTSVIALSVGGLFLVWRRIVPWQIPLGFLGGMLLFALVFWWSETACADCANPLHHLIYGYILIGAFFLAPDLSTSPYTGWGALLFGTGAGILTMIIRYWGAYADGVFFAILFMNTLTPVLDRLRFRSYGRAGSAG